jgi:hypothetical protein
VFRYSSASLGGEKSLLMSIFPQTTSDVPQYLVTPRSEFGEGSPIVTTTDGRSNPIVWILGAQGDERLHGYRGDTGEPLYTSDPMTGLRHLQTLLAAGDRLYVGADGRLYAFAF